MTAITLQSANESLAIPDEHTQGFFPKRITYISKVEHRPPKVDPHILVGLSHYSGSALPEVACFMQHHALDWPRPTVYYSLPFTEWDHRYWVVLRIGPLICTVFGYTLDPAKFIDEEYVPLDAVREIMRSRGGAATWPPPLSMDDSMFERWILFLNRTVWSPEESS